MKWLNSRSNTKRGQVILYVTKTFTQTFGLTRFPNNAYEAIKLTKGGVSQCPVQF
jgi:hypothetical protein